MRSAITQGIRVSVQSRYLPHQSNPSGHRFAFAYAITIENTSDLTVQLRRRHWLITDGQAHVEEVEGEGVIGEQPVLRPGDSYAYSSGCLLKTPWGTMRGHYAMHAEDGDIFEAEVPEFLLATPNLPILSEVH